MRPNSIVEVILGSLYQDQPLVKVSYFNLKVSIEIESILVPT